MQPKSATEISLMTSTMECGKILKNLGICKFFLILELVLIFPVTSPEVGQEIWT
jgi:hypothetical protein